MAFNYIHNSFCYCLSGSEYFSSDYHLQNRAFIDSYYQFWQWSYSYFLGQFPKWFLNHFRVQLAIIDCCSSSFDLGLASNCPSFAFRYLGLSYLVLNRHLVTFIGIIEDRCFSLVQYDSFIKFHRFHFRCCFGSHYLNKVIVPCCQARKASLCCRSQMAFSRQILIFIAAYRNFHLQAKNFIKVWHV